MVCRLQTAIEKGGMSAWTIFPACHVRAAKCESIVLFVVPHYVGPFLVRVGPHPPLPLSLFGVNRAEVLQLPRRNYCWKGQKRPPNHYQTLPFGTSVYQNDTTRPSHCCRFIPNSLLLLSSPDPCASICVVWVIVFLLAVWNPKGVINFVAICNHIEIELFDYWLIISLVSYGIFMDSRVDG